MKNFVKEFIVVIFVDPFCALLVSISTAALAFVFAIQALKGHDPGALAYEVRAYSEAHGVTGEDLKAKRPLMPLTTMAYQRYAKLLGW